MEITVRFELHTPLEYRGGNQNSQRICQTGLELQALGHETVRWEWSQLPSRAAWLEWVKTQMPGEGHPVPREDFDCSIWVSTQSLPPGQFLKCKGEGRSLIHNDQLSNTVKVNCKCEFSTPSLRYYYLVSHKAKPHAWQVEHLETILPQKSIKRHFA